MADQPNLLRGFTIARMSRTGACDNAVVIRGCGLLVALHKQFCKHCFIVHPNRADFVDEGNIGKSIAHTTTKILDQCENPSGWISNQCILHSKWHKTPSHLSATRIFHTPPPPPPLHTHKKNTKVSPIDLNPPSLFQVFHHIIPLLSHQARYIHYKKCDRTCQKICDIQQVTMVYDSRLMYSSIDENLSIRQQQSQHSWSLHCISQILEGFLQDCNM